jgi:hypothetical protein
MQPKGYGTFYTTQLTLISVYFNGVGIPLYWELLDNVSCVMPHPQPLPAGRGVDNQIVTSSPPCGEQLSWKGRVGQKQYYATYVR